jgi:hypothetical protein
MNGDLSAATRELLRATRLYGEDPTSGWSQLRGAYIAAVEAGMAPERIRGLTGFSRDELDRIVGEP